MPPRFRIVRKRVSFASSIMRLDRLFMALTKAFWIHPMQAQERMNLDALRAEKLRKDTDLAEMRRQKICNELVIQDLKIEAMNKEAGHPVPPEWTYQDDRMP